LNKHHIAKKYSRAMISSLNISDIPGVIGELKVFSGIIEANRQLRLLFSSQIFNDAEKEKAFDALAPALKFGPGAEKFLKLMIAQGHLAAIREIIATTTDAYNVRQKKATAVVLSPVAMDRKYAERLRDALKKMTGREVTVENRIDESLLGGFIVKVGSTIFDSSVKGQLRLLRAELLK